MVAVGVGRIGLVRFRRLRRCFLFRLGRHHRCAGGKDQFRGFLKLGVADRHLGVERGEGAGGAQGEAGRAQAVDAEAGGEGDEQGQGVVGHLHAGQAFAGRIQIGGGGQADGGDGLGWLDMKGEAVEQGLRRAFVRAGGFVEQDEGVAVIGVEQLREAGGEAGGVRSAIVRVRVEGWSARPASRTGRPSASEAAMLRPPKSWSSVIAG